jgi:hypothetical protein
VQVITGKSAPLPAGEGLWGEGHPSPPWHWLIAFSPMVGAHPNLGCAHWGEKRGFERPMRAACHRMRRSMLQRTRLLSRLVVVLALSPQAWAIGVEARTSTYEPTPPACIDGVSRSPQ